MAQVQGDTHLAPRAITIIPGEAAPPTILVNQEIAALPPGVLRDEGGIYAKDAIREVNADLSNRANSLVVLTWNAEGMTKDAAEVLIDRLQLDDFK